MDSSQSEGVLIKVQPSFYEIADSLVPKIIGLWILASIPQLINETSIRRKLNALYERYVKFVNQLKKQYLWCVISYARRAFRYMCMQVPKE